MDLKKAYRFLEQDCPNDYRINEIISFAYPYRHVKISATVSKSPEAPIQQVYSVFLRSIMAGYDTNEKLTKFLGLEQNDFLLRELFFLREKGYVDLVSDTWKVGSQGEKYIKDNSLLKIIEDEELEFLVDGITGEIRVKEFLTHSQQSKKLNPEISFKIKDPALIADKSIHIIDVYNKQNQGQSILVDYDRSKLLFDKLEYQDFLLIEYTPVEATTHEPFIEIRSTDDNFTLNRKLTRILSDRYPGIIYELSDTSRGLVSKSETIKQPINTLNQDIQVNITGKTVRTMTVWETRAYIDVALTTVEHKILIESPWVKAATNNYIEKITHLLAQNKTVYILYGIEHNDNHDDKVMNRLKKLNEHHPYNLHLIHLPSHFMQIGNKTLSGTHRKLIIKDNDYYILGSFNFLSFNRHEGERVANEESVLISENVEEKWNQIRSEYSLKNII